jgi:gliding motility-associated-like protein
VKRPLGLRRIFAFVLNEIARLCMGLQGTGIEAIDRDTISYSVTRILKNKPAWMKKGVLIFLFLFLTIRVYSQCTLSITITKSDSSICSGYTMTLTAKASAGTTPYSYSWNTGENTQSIIVDKAGTYTVTVTDHTTGCQPVQQSVIVTATTTPVAPTAPGVTACGGSQATLTATAPGGTYQWYSAATGGTFLATGATFTTPVITAQTSYYVETTVNGCTSPRTQVVVSLPTKPVAVGVSICSGNVATLTATGGQNFTWYDGSGTVVGSGATFTTPVLTGNIIFYVSSVTSSGCTSPKEGVEVRVSPTPPAPSVQGTSVCSGSSANLQASGGSGTFNWYSAPSGGTPLISSPDFTTPALTTTTTYYVSEQDNECEGPRSAVTVTVNPIPTAPASQNDTTCYQSRITLTASGSTASNYQWFNAPGGELLATGTTYTTPVLIYSTTYYLAANSGGCSSSYVPVNVYVQPPLPLPSAPGAIICNGSTAILTASAQGGGTFQWYNAQTGGTLLESAATFTTPSLSATTTYYVQNTQNGCVSARAPITVTVLAQIPAPVAANASVCSGNSTSLSASGSGGGYEWYDSATGGNLLSTNQVYITPGLTTNTTYYVEAESNNCPSARTAVTVTVNPTPSITANNVTICPNSAAVLTATAAGGTIDWYNAASGGNLIATGATYTTPTLLVNTTYYVEDYSGECSTGRIPVNVIINTSYYPQFAYSSGNYCIDAPNPTPQINNPNGGTFSATPAGLVFVSTTTGEINISASSPGTYTVSFAGLGQCAGTESASISIGTAINSSFSYNGNFCQGEADPVPSYNGAPVSGNYSASPAGLVFVSTTTGQIDLSQSTPGTYTITNTYAGTGSCAPGSSSQQVTIYQQVLVYAGPDQTAAAGSSVQLAGSISGGTTSGTWSGGTGSFADPTSTTTVYTPGQGETSAKLTLTSATPPGPCGAASSFVTINFATAPPAPTAAGAITCAGSAITLSATAPGGTYQWYDAPTGGTLLSTGTNYTTQPLTANTAFYVQTTRNGITSARSPVFVTVNNVPAAPVSSNVQVCGGSVTTLVATGSTGSYQWYDAPTGGNLLSTESSYITPPITGNTAFFVQTTVNSCISSRTEVGVTIVTAPIVTSAPNTAICSGQALNYTIAANQPTATFNWSRAAVAGISNSPEANQTSSVITDALINTTNSIITVIYVITPFAGQCPGPAFNYAVDVYPVPVVTSAAADTVCNGVDNSYTVTFNTQVGNFTWSRAAVAGISNQAVSGQAATTIRETLFNTTTSPIIVTYIFTYGTETCPGSSFTFSVTVNPQALVVSPDRGVACFNEPEAYDIVSNIPSATYSWSRVAVAGVTNPAVTDQTSSTIAETLTNTTTSPVNIVYLITPMAYGCPGTVFTYNVTVYPLLATPAVSSNSPICIADTIDLTTPPVSGATYLWTGPSGYSSTRQNPQITNAGPANSGVYTLVYFNAQGCASASVSINVAVDALPVANAGPNISVCSAINTIPLQGIVSGGTTTGIWSTSGSGTFSPSATDLTANYLPSDSDKTAGTVTLTLSSTSQDNCTVSTSSMTITFTKLPAAIAGPNQLVCTQSGSVQLSGAISISGGGKWSTEGTGIFTPSVSDLNATYVPSPADISNGEVELRLTVNDPGICYAPVDSLTVFFIPPAAVFAGGSKYVLKGGTVVLTPTVSEAGVHYLWSPDVDINNDTLKNPTITGDQNNMVYTLTVTDSRGCVSSDTVLIKVSPLVVIPNTFTPNGDGINDYWDIQGLIAYSNATVDIFDRYGQSVFHSVGYPKPWDGSYAGKQAPVGVYYYIIKTNFDGQVFSGWVTVIR